MYYTDCQLLAQLSPAAVPASGRPDRLGGEDANGAWARYACIVREATAREAALRYVAAQPRTVQDVRRRLARAGIPDSGIDDAVEWLTGLGYLDDAAYARAYAASRRGSRRRVSQALQRKGVDREVIDVELASLTPEEELARAVDLARRKARVSSGLPGDVRLRRLAAVLLRAGFPPPVAYQVARDTLAGEEQS